MAQAMIDQAAADVVSATVEEKPPTAYVLALTRLQNRRKQLSIPTDSFSVSGAPNTLAVICWETGTLVPLGKVFRIIVKPVTGVQTKRQPEDYELVVRNSAVGAFASPAAAVKFAADCDCEDFAQYTADYYTCDKAHALPSALNSARVAATSGVHSMFQQILAATERDLALIAGKVEYHVKRVVSKRTGDDSTTDAEAPPKAKRSKKSSKENAAPADANDELTQVMNTPLA